LTGGLGPAPASANTKRAASKATVATATVRLVGPFAHDVIAGVPHQEVLVLVDRDHRTLYTLSFSGDPGDPVPCVGRCTRVWPPLVLANEASLKAGKGVHNLDLGPGGRQVTASGLPLYRYSGDTKAGQANGEGIISYGGVWRVARAEANA
jgi:predicted lipoprotein with Yx(FWY)xxD motif